MKSLLLIPFPQMSLLSYTSSHPFPSYEEMIRLMEDYPDLVLSVGMFAEYGRPHHDALKAAYESGMSRAAVRACGQKIHSLGGIQAMRMNYYALAHFSPFRLSTDPDIYYAYKELDYGWDGIGGWLA